MSISYTNFSKLLEKTDSYNHEFNSDSTSIAMSGSGSFIENWLKIAQKDSKIDIRSTLINAVYNMLPADKTQMIGESLHVQLLEICAYHLVRIELFTLFAAA